MEALKLPKKLAHLLGLALLLLSLFLLVKTIQSITVMTESESWREISVEGEGTATAVPDKASFSVGLYLEGDTSEELSAQAETISGDILASLAEVGIPEEDISTDSYYLSPRWNWTDEEGSFQDGFTLSQYYTVTVNDVNMVNDAVSAASAAGATNVGSVYFELSDSDELIAQAREAAVENAREKAEQISDASGLRLGRVVGYYEYDDYYGGYGKGGYYYDEYALGAMEGEVEERYEPNIELGQEEVTLTVSLTFKVK